MNGWQTDKRWSDRFLPEIKRAVGETLIGAAPVEEDAERNTDLIVLRLDAVRVACRVRKHSYLDRYGSQFTIRVARPSGNKTELEKIVEGWGDYIFYGFADEAEKTLIRWIIGDLHVFRGWYSKSLLARDEPGIPQDNLDGSSSFRAFEIHDLPRSFVKAWHNAAPHLEAA